MSNPLHNTGTVIINTGCANLASVDFALQRIGCNPVISQDLAVIKSAQRVILPGVGSADAAMDKLNTSGLSKTIKDLKMPVLGICLGMQLLGNRSEEGDCRTLGVIAQTIKQLKPSPNIFLPHMGWNRLTFKQKDHPLLVGIENGSYVYFVHSYAWPNDKNTVATSNHGQTFAAIVQQDNFMGVQFHPERSGKTGEQLLKNFIDLQPKQQVMEEQ